MQIFYTITIKCDKNLKKFHLIFFCTVDKFMTEFHTLKLFSTVAHTINKILQASKPDKSTPRHMWGQFISIRGVVTDF